MVKLKYNNRKGAKMKKVFSEWFRIDLHIHTDKSKETKNGDYKGSFSITTLKQKLKHENVQIFSLTDHNIINLQAYKEYYESYNSENDPLLLLGVELDIEGSTKTYHTLIVFNHSDYDSAERISKTLEDKYAERGIIDKKQRQLTLDDIVTIFKKEDFFFIPHAGNASKNIVSGNRDKILETEEMLILMQSALEKVTDEEIKEHYQVGFDRVLNNNFKDRNDIAYINFSDNHNCEKYPDAHFGENTHIFYYIKGAKSYESIRLAFIDPASRIKSQEEYDKIKFFNNKIEKLRITNESDISNTELFFSPHLNTIIGGRSSGKSLLLWLLGNVVDGIPNLNTDKYSIEIDNVSIKAKNDSEYTSRTSLSNNIIYIQQGEITDYFEKKELSSLATKTGKKDDYDRITTKFYEKKTTLLNTIEQLSLIYKETFDDFNQQKIFILHKSDIDNILCKDYAIKFTPEISLQNIENLKKDLTLLETTIDSITAILKIDYLHLTDNEKEKLQETITLLTDKTKFVKILIDKLRKFDLLKERINEIVTTFNTKLSTGATKKHVSNINIKNLKLAIKERFSISKRLSYITNNIQNFSYQYQESLSLSSEISLVREIREKEKILERIKDGLLIPDQNSNKSLYVHLLNLVWKSDKYSIKNYSNNTPENFKKKLFKQIEDINDYIEHPIDYLQYSDGQTSEKRSPGYNSEQYLKIILKSPNNTTIFIDQPEDNLGSNFITNELVPIIRDIKNNKQIFFVTHNPSIVVYGDAEAVILAENRENKISYKQLILEDKDSQEIICNTLDGGQYIFYNRFNKYDIHRLQLKEKNQ